MLGFGEGEGREIEKREKRQSFFLRLCFLYLGFYRVLEKVFLRLFIYLFFGLFFSFLNTVLTWKIVGGFKGFVFFFPLCFFF